MCSASGRCLFFPCGHDFLGTITCCLGLKPCWVDLCCCLHEKVVRKTERLVVRLLISFGASRCWWWFFFCVIFLFSWMFLCAPALQRAHRKRDVNKRIISLFSPWLNFNNFLDFSLAPIAPHIQSTALTQHIIHFLCFNSLVEWYLSSFCWCLLFKRLLIGDLSDPIETDN